MVLTILDYLCKRKINRGHVIRNYKNKQAETGYNNETIPAINLKETTQPVKPKIAQ